MVQSAGNAYSVGDDTNLHNFQNSRYIITVGATDYFGRSSSFSTTGASILVSAPGGDGNQGYASILTTDLNGSAGHDKGNFTFIDGTSFAAPIVSAIVALMLEINPRLGYRDVQQILAFTALKTNVSVGDWATNGAGEWNGGGLHFNALTHATGFGQVDALAAVRLAASWDEPARTAANAHEVTGSRSVNATIPDNTQAGLVSSITLTESSVVERVDVRVNIKHGFVGDLSVMLVSPSGTVSFLVWRPAQGALSVFGSSQDDIQFTFDTVLCWGEDSAGTWTLQVVDNQDDDVGMLLDWSITVVGHKQSPDDVFVYTNEYPDVIAADPSRATLRDLDGGFNTLNAAALGLDNRIDLSGRTDTILNQAKLGIAPGTTISKAIGGEGNDILIAGDGASVLRGMWGQDQLIGGPGIDTAVYAIERASAQLARTPTGWTVSAGAEGTDSLTEIERVNFGHTYWALDTHGNAGMVAKILGAVFGAAAVENPAYAGIGLHLVDGGMGYESLIQLAIDARLGVGAGHKAVVDLLYTNVVGKPPPPAEEAYFVGLLERQVTSVAGLGRLAAETDLNAANIDLVGLMQQGLEYLPYGGA